MPAPDQSASYVFLSYNTKDLTIVKVIADWLKAKCVATWIDTECIYGGVRHQSKITAAMKQAKANIIFYGKYGLGDYQAEEVELASGLCTKKGICAIVVLLPEVDKAKALEDEKLGFLVTRNFIIFKTETDEGEMNRLLRSLPAVDELKSEKGVDYTKLCQFLQAENWHLADRETYEVMIQALGKNSGQTFGTDELLNFPDTDLKTIDGLWTKYSDGRFGFSVQKQVYLECGGCLDGEYPGSTIWHTFCKTVGWQLNGKSVEAIFDLSSPYGHLPFKDKQVSLRFSSHVNDVYGLLWNALLSHQNL